MLHTSRYNLFELWLHRWLYRLLLLVSVSLGLVVLLLPWVTLPNDRDPLIVAGSLFANDVTLRQTTVVSAVGLWLTAIIFFRPRNERQWIWRRGRFVSLD